MGDDPTAEGRPPNEFANDEREAFAYRLRERERFLRTLISNLPGIVYRRRPDDEWTAEFMSEGVGVVGYSAEDFTASRRVTWFDIIHPEDRGRVRAEVFEVIQRSIPFGAASYLLSYRLFAKSGELRYVRDRFRLVYDEGGRPTALEGVVTDITELTEAFERVRESEARYRLLAENINDLVCLHDLDGTFLYLSPSSARVLDFTPDELVGTSPYDLFHPEDAPRVREEARARLLAGETEVLNEYRMRRKGGEYVWLETMSQRVVTERGELVRLLTCSRDITERKLVEEERLIIEEERAASLVREQNLRQEAERAREEALHAGRVKDEFLLMVSHEFRTPLTTIKAAARVLLGGGESPEERREYLETISTECDRQIDMIINLLDIARLEEGGGGVDLKHERVNLSEVLRSCDRIERHAAEARGQEFVVESGEGLPSVRGDAKALRRALCTIVENAVKYTPEGGRIEVSAALTTAEEIAVHITDDGRGIRPEDLPHIFDKFFRGKKPQDPAVDGTPDDAVKPETPGVGLGLYLAERLVRALDGRIEVESRPNRGSRFSVILPVWNDALHQHDEVDEYGFEEGT